MRQINADVLKSILLVDRYRILEADKMGSYIPMARIFEIIDTLESVENEKQWIEFKSRKMDEEEKEAFPNCCSMLDCELPEDGQDILVSDGVYVWADVFYNDGDDGCGLEGSRDIEDGMAWMPMPEPYRGVTE